MSPLLLAAMLAMAPGDQPAAANAPEPSGKWLIVYAEEKGRRIQKWEQQPATLKEGKLTYESDGKEHTLQLKFGPHQTVTTTGSLSETGGEGASGEGHGVYIAAQDYLCLSLKRGAAGGQGGGRGAGAGNAGGEGAGHHSSGDFILILRRQR